MEVSVVPLWFPHGDFDWYKKSWKIKKKLPYKEPNSNLLEVQVNFNKRWTIKRKKNISWSYFERIFKKYNVVQKKIHRQAHCLLTKCLLCLDKWMSLNEISNPFGNRYSTVWANKITKGWIMSLSTVKKYPVEIS